VCLIDICAMNKIEFLVLLTKWPRWAGTGRVRVKIVNNVQVSQFGKADHAMFLSSA
jgi:hypothetical protein